MVDPLAQERVELEPTLPDNDVVVNPVTVDVGHIIANCESVCVCVCM